MCDGRALVRKIWLEPGERKRMAHVLVVDDDPDIRSLIAETLVRRNHTIVQAADGPTGLAAAREHLPDVILLDWMMPGMSGVELCAVLRADPMFENTTIMLITARCEESDRIEGTRAGADDFIHKPFSLKDLRSRVDAAAASSQMAS
jgi:two-component system, OmpR family, phosphate regulon response regulator PhoB